MKIFNSKTGKDIVVAEPTNESIAALVARNLAITLPNKGVAFGVEFSYNIKKAGPYMMAFQVTSPKIKGVISVDWHPGSGWNAHNLDWVFGEGNGICVFEKFGWPHQRIADYKILD